MSTIYTQLFFVNRHGSRYSIKPPVHNVLWPKEKEYWDSHVGKLTPVGVIELCNLGTYFRQRYPWVNPQNVTVYSTSRSRALESAWALLLGLLPGTPVKFQSLRAYQPCKTKMCCGSGICCISYYHKPDDPIFGQYDPSLSYKINVNESPFLRQLVDDPIITNLIDRLSKNGHFRIRRDSVTTVAKLKDIYGQIQVDSQLKIPDHASLVGEYGITEQELELINKIGSEVICRRSVPSTDKVSSQTYNADQGSGILNTIKTAMNNWDKKSNTFCQLSCHDTNIIAVMALLGIKITTPDFAGYILIERQTNGYQDRLAFYYVQSPFNNSVVSPRVWTPLQHRDTYVNWDELSKGVFETSDFIQMLS